MHGRDNLTFYIKKGEIAKLNTQKQIPEKNSRGNKMKIEDYTIAELIQMKEEVEEIYGEGEFRKYVGKDIVSLLGFSVENFGEEDYRELR